MRYSTLTAACATLYARVAYSACSVQATTTLSDLKDVTAIASCTTFSGSVALATGVVGPKINLDGLEEIAGALVIANNSNIRSLSSDSLRIIQDTIAINGNTALRNITFDNLTSVGGAVDLAGNLTDVSMSELETVRGAFLVNSTNDSLDCRPFGHLETSGVQGKYLCLAEDPDASTSAPTSQPTSSTALLKSTSASASSTQTRSSSPSPSASSSPSTGRTIGIAVGVTLAAVAVILVGVLLLLRRIKKARKEKDVERKSLVVEDKDTGALAELSHESRPWIEMGNGREAHELPSQHGFGEARSEHEIQHAPAAHELHA